MIFPLLAASLVLPTVAPPPPAPTFRAGAVAVDITPKKFPVLVNGGFLQAIGDKALTPLHAKAIALDDGKTRVVFVVVDSCMVPRDLIDKAKGIASKKTGLAADCMMVSSTHTHTAPSAMGTLGCPADPGYVAFLPDKIAEAIEGAIARLAPAKVGWGVVQDPEHTHTRRWIRRPDKLVVDPFGQATGRANMHPGHENPDVISPSGPSDPALTVLSVQTPDGKPIALLANYSMHYFGAAPLSADYYGRFGQTIRKLVGGDDAFVGAMSQGTSGDQQWMDYGKKRVDPGLDAYADALAAKAFEAYGSIKHGDNAPLAMAQATLKLRRRVPDAARLAWAKPIVDAMGDRVPKTLPEVYAKEVFFLHNEPERELILQAIRVGELGITAIPDEVYAITGLKLKVRSPFPLTMNIELANGAEGYIPPPEQHRLGGYTTWPARTASLEVEAEPKIVKTLLELLAKLDPPKPEAKNAYADRPGSAHHYEFDELEGTTALDTGTKPKDGRFEGNVAFYLDGPSNSPDKPNHAVYLAGGRLLVPGPAFPDSSVSLHFWSGLPSDARPVTGVIYASEGGDTLEIGGTSGNPGRLVFRASDGTKLVGGPVLEPKTWHHVSVRREGGMLSISVDGKFHTNAVKAPPFKVDGEIWIGGTAEPQSRFEGKIDRVLIQQHSPAPKGPVEQLDRLPGGDIKSEAKK